MSEQQLHLFNGIGLVVLVVVAILTRATLRRIAGAAAGYRLGVSAEPLSAAVPEPTTLLVLLVAALEAYCCRRKHR
jgi:hypothetical protein